MHSQRFGLDRLARQRAGGSGEEELASVSRRRDPGGAVNLQTDVAGGATLDVADVQPHPHAQLADLRGPGVGAHGPQRADRRARGRRASGKVAKKASPSVPSTYPPSASMAPPTSAW